MFAYVCIYVFACFKTWCHQIKVAQIPAQSRIHFRKRKHLTRTRMWREMIFSRSSQRWNAAVCRVAADVLWKITVPQIFIHVVRDGYVKSLQAQTMPPTMSPWPIASSVFCTASWISWTWTCSQLAAMLHLRFCAREGWCCFRTQKWGSP